MARMQPKFKAPGGIWLVSFVVVAATTALGGCTPWPTYATGGLAERYQTAWAPLAGLERRYDAALRAGGDRFAASRMIDTQLLLARAQREHEGGLIEDANLTLTKADGLLRNIEHDLQARKGRTS
jgi:type IV pilus biogenesis protein CpaD/CtpE